MSFRDREEVWLNAYEDARADGHGPDAAAAYADEAVISHESSIADYATDNYTQEDFDHAR